eukprot:scaffold994_cov226-Prasinococcus_capsulatus_cf.AAC.23
MDIHVDPFTIPIILHKGPQATQRLSHTSRRDLTAFASLGPPCPGWPSAFWAPHGPRQDEGGRPLAGPVGPRTRLDECGVQPFQ